MASSNLRQQFLQSIIRSGMFGKSKHELKSGTENDGSGYMEKNPWVFSDNYKNGLKAFTSQVAKYMRANYPEIRQLTRIRTRHWNEFLEVKAVTCSSETLGLYYSYVHKIEECATLAWNLEYPLNWTKGLIRPKSLKTPSGELLRVQQMTVIDFEKIMEYMSRPGTWGNAHKAFMLSRKLGLRVQECSDIKAENIYFEGGKWGYGYAEIWGKGKRYRKIDIKCNEDNSYLQGLVAGLKKSDKIVGIDAYSINYALRTACNALGIKKKYPLTGIHSIRKLYSQETFRWVKAEKGMSEINATRYVNAQLGHSEERDEELLAVYVKDVKRKRERTKNKNQRNRV